MTRHVLAGRKEQLLPAIINGQRREMNMQSHCKRRPFNESSREYSSSSSLPTSGATFAAAPLEYTCEQALFDDDIGGVNENHRSGAFHREKSDGMMDDPESLLASFMSTVDQCRLDRILDEQEHIPSGVRYAHFPNASAHEDHTSETIFGMDLHSLRVGELMNDAVISAFAKIAFANSLHWERRSVITPYLSKQVELHPERFGRDALMRLSDSDKPGAPWLPTAYSDVILVPYSRSMHWTLAILIQSQRRTLALHQNSLQSDLGHRSALSSVLHHCELLRKNSNLQRFPGPYQEDGYNCGVAVCLAMYIWLMHPDPFAFNWERLEKLSPKILDEYRKYILYVVATGEIENIFEEYEELTERPISEEQECEQAEELDTMDTSTECSSVGGHACDNNSIRNDDERTVHASPCPSSHINSSGDYGFQPVWINGINRSTPPSHDLLPKSNRLQSRFFLDEFVDPFGFDYLFSPPRNAPSHPFPSIWNHGAW